MVVLKEITDNSWLVMSEEQEQIALLSSSPKGFVLLSKGGRVKFATKDDVEDFFEEKVFDKVIQSKKTEAKEHFVKGYPVDFDTPFEADSEDELSELPLFTKTKTSKVYHCAGYYCILFPKGWTHSFCPKKDTLDKYEYVGPLKTEMEMKSHLSMLKQNDKRS